MAPIAFKLADKPSFDVGGLQTNPVDEFSPRNGYPWMTRLANGNVVVLDRTRVHFFDASGRKIKIFGREGRGPGEFVNTSNVCATRGDTVLVGQSQLPLTKLTSQGELAGILPLENGTLTEGAICFGDGTFVVLGRVTGGANGSSRIYRYTRRGTDGALNTVADYEPPPYDALVSSPNPWGAHGDRLYFANGHTFDILAYDRGGKLAEIIRTSDARVPLTDADKKKLPMGAHRAGSTQAEREAAHRRAIANSSTKFMPTVGSMHVDIDGRIWVQDWQLGNDLTRPIGWTAFDSSGRLLGRLTIPGAPAEHRRLVVHFGKNEVFFRRLDDDGAVHYTAYPIEAVKP